MGLVRAALFVSCATRLQQQYISGLLVRMLVKRRRATPGKGGVALSDSSSHLPSSLTVSVCNRREPAWIWGDHPRQRARPTKDLPDCSADRIIFEPMPHADTEMALGRHHGCLPTTATLTNQQYQARCPCPPAIVFTASNTKQKSHAKVLEIWCDDSIDRLARHNRRRSCTPTRGMTGNWALTMPVRPGRASSLTISVQQKETDLEIG
jgi:hypothetical protein